jgi:hypothetical protein
MIGIFCAKRDTPFGAESAAASPGLAERHVTTVPPHRQPRPWRSVKSDDQ